MDCGRLIIVGRSGSLSRVSLRIPVRSDLESQSHTAVTVWTTVEVLWMVVVTTVVEVPVPSV